MVLEGGTPGLEGTPQATREEQGQSSSSSDIYDAGWTNPSGHWLADAAPRERNRLRFTKVHNIGTWNVRGMNTGKLDIVKAEMERLNIDILGISELHWIGSGYFNSDDYTVYYSGNDNTRRNGVAVIASKEVAKAVQRFNAINDRVMSIRLHRKPRSFTILQVYAPTTDANEEDIERFYADLQQAIDQAPAKDAILIAGDFNAKVGAGEEPPVAGRFGLGERNEAGDRLVQCCQENRLAIANTWFEQPKRRLYTWTAPNGQHRNQIDYFLCQQRWKSSIQAIKTLLGADCGSDHQLLIAKVKIRFNTIKRQPATQRFDTSNIPAEYAVEVNNRLDSLSATKKDPDELWEEMKAIITAAAEHFIPYKTSAKRPKWLSDATIEIANKRRAAKAAGKSTEFRSLNADFQREARRDKERYWNERCAKLEDASKRGHTRELFAQVKQARAPFAPRKAGIIKDRDGKVLRSEDQIKRRWQEYTAELYAGNRASQPADQEDITEQEPDILDEEVAWALKQLPNRKAPGIDCIPAELLKSVPIPTLATLC
uniref:Endonuclease/exonuclease/phosphatase domain-containing protein n=1 Tax=Plectus sambesii TaxID=2011161 RepID=A0A914XJB6_9BILA